LSALVATLLVTLIWLAGRYEASQVQSRLERDAAEALSDIRGAMTPQRAVAAGPAGRARRRCGAWTAPTPCACCTSAAKCCGSNGAITQLARARRSSDTPYRPPVFDRLGRVPMRRPTSRWPAPTARRSSGAPATPPATSCRSWTAWAWR
jgi:two-component system sensor histidine kinase DctS